MMIVFRSKLFDASGEKGEDSFYGEDLARWLQVRLSGWQTSVVGEDWGWAIVAKKAEYRYLFGVYDHDTNDVTDAGPLWILRLFDRRDHRSWWRGLFKYTPPKAHDDVTAEIVEVLSQDGGISDIKVEALT